jgi:hypothetical protein
MAGIMQTMLSQVKRPEGLIDLAGAERTVEWIEENGRVEGEEG